MMRKIIFLSLLLLVLPLSVAAQAAGQVTYTEEKPLIYEGAQDMWPYSFLNEHGQPDGFNIELMRLLLGRLGIPYKIQMRQRLTVFKDLKEGNCDITIGLTAGFHEDVGLYSQNAVTLFTQSILSPKSNPTEVRNFRDLGTHRVYVNDSSLCHHLMIDYGWGGNAIPTRNIQETILKISTEEDGELVWNTISLKWLLRKFQIDNLEITPVNMPHGEYRFISNDKHLLWLLDSIYTELNSTEELTPLHNKWFYPERSQQTIQVWVWYVGGSVVFLLLLLAAYAVTYQLQARRIMRDNSQTTRRLALILEAGGVRVWIYDAIKQSFDWIGENGQVACTFTIDEFAQRFPPEEFTKLMMAIRRLAKDGTGSEETLFLKTLDAGNDNKALRDYRVTLSVVLKASQVIATMVDVTEEQRQRQAAEERRLRLRAIFHTPLVGIMYFDREGLLADANERVCEMLCCDRETILKTRVPLRDVLDTGSLSLDEMDGYDATQYVNIDRIQASEQKIPFVRRTGILCNEFSLLAVRGEEGGTEGIFAVCRDITNVMEGLRRQREKESSIDRLKALLADYDDSIDSVLRESDVRLAAYSTETHTLSIYRTASDVQHSLTQTRCMSLVDDHSKRLAMRVIDQMDDCQDRSIKADIYTTLRIRGGRQLAVQFCLTPLKDHTGHITAYVGLVRDFSELRDIERQMAVETAKVQEVENAKNSLVKNMVQEIRRPMATIVDYVGQLPAEAPCEGEERLRQGILSNADQLLHLIENILFLSRLEAHMVEIHRQECNYAFVFEAQCAAEWERLNMPATRLVVENAYEELTVEVDSDNMGYVMRQLLSNAARHTKGGTVRVRLEYIVKRLIISVDDNGEGMTPTQLEALNNPGTPFLGSGLGLPICRELLQQMGGTIELSSELGAGTTVWLTIPCAATTVRRKKQL